MKKLYNTIRLVQDSATREALTIIADELTRIKSINPVTEDTKSLSVAINKIIGTLK